MPMHRLRGLAVATAVLIVVATACGSSASKTSAPATSSKSANSGSSASSATSTTMGSNCSVPGATAPAVPTSTPIESSSTTTNHSAGVPRPSGSLTVFAAASLTEAFNAAKAQLATADPGLHLTYSFAGSQQLVAQIQAGAPVDVVATADTTTMAKLVQAGLVDPPRTFARNKLEIVVARRNPKHVSCLSDLARPDLKVVLEDPSVPAGKYGRQALGKLGIKVSPVSLELDVKSELQKVISGNADAGIVYVTDVTSAGPLANGVPIPDDQNVVATYPVAVIKAARNQTGAQAFADDVVSGTTQQTLRAKGFLAP